MNDFVFVQNFQTLEDLEGNFPDKVLFETFSPWFFELFVYFAF